MTEDKLGNGDMDVWECTQDYRFVFNFLLEPKIFWNTLCEWEFIEQFTWGF